jgi:hypothetical protein
MLPAALGSKPWLLVSYAVFLVCLVAIVIGWHGRPPADSADFDLHDDKSSSNLIDTSAEEPANPAKPLPQPTVVQELPPPPPAETPVVIPRELGPVVQVKTEDPIPPPPPPENKGPADLPPPPAMKLEPPPLAPVPESIHVTEAITVPGELTEPELSDPIIDWHRGDVPMTRNWHKVLGYQAVLAAAMLAGQASAEDNGKSPSDKPAGIDAKAIKEQLDRIETSTKALDTIKNDIKGLKDEIKVLRTSNTSEFEAVNKRVGELEKKLASFEANLKARVANIQPANGVPPSPTAGRVRLVNGFNRKATIFLNDAPHPLDPGKVEELTLPAGSYTFWVLVDGFAMVQPPTIGTLTAGGSRTIEIFTR